MSEKLNQITGQGGGPIVRQRLSSQVPSISELQAEEKFRIETGLKDLRGKLERLSNKED